VAAAELDSYQFYTLLYVDGDNMVLMHEETFEQTEIPSAMVGSAAPYLSDGMRMRVEIFEGAPLQVKPPVTAEYTVAEALAVRSDTQNSASYKSVTLHNGQRLMVPPFVNEGDIVAVNLESLEYSERVKKA
jgi:elongation factor P